MEHETCYSCGGTGEAFYNVSCNPDIAEYMLRVCERCYGSGREPVKTREVFDESKAREAIRKAIDAVKEFEE
jgi:DnaJ-class molecular chaperone